MRITVVAVGKLKERFWADACAEYLKRLGAYAKVGVVEVADVDPGRAGGVDAARAKEGDAILAALPAGAHVVLMAIEGRQRHARQQLCARAAGCHARYGPRQQRQQHGGHPPVPHREGPAAKPGAATG